MILGLSLEQYARVRQYRGEYVFTEDESEEWRDLATIRQAGRAIGAGYSVSVAYTTNTVKGIRIIRADETVLDEHATVLNTTEFIEASELSENVPGFQEFPFDCYVQPGDKLQLLINDQFEESGAKVTARVFVVREDDAAVPDVCVLGDGKHPGAPVAVMLTAIDSTLRLGDHLADSE